MNRRRKISNRFVTKIEDEFLLGFPFFSAVLAAHNGGGTLVVRCCDDATGTYMVIM